MEKEIWKDINGYEGIYQASNKGGVRGIDRCVSSKGSGRRFIKGVNNKISIDRYGYYMVYLHRNGVSKNKAVHTLIWDAFGNSKRNGIKLQVDHIDNDKTNNNINNLQLLSCRDNLHKYHKTNKNKISKYIGVSFNKRHNKWNAKINVNGKSKWIGTFNDEISALTAYEKTFKRLNERGLL